MIASVAGQRLGRPSTRRRRRAPASAASKPWAASQPAAPPWRSSSELQRAAHRLGPRAVRLRGAALEVGGVRRRRAQPRQQRLEALAGRDVVGDDGRALHPDQFQRQGAHHAGPVLARGAVHDDAARRVRDVAQRPHDRIGAVEQVAQVCLHGARLAAVVLELPPLPGQDAVEREIGARADLGHERAMADLDALLAQERAGALELDLDLGAQVDHGAHAEVPHQRPTSLAVRPCRLSARRSTPGAVVPPPPNGSPPRSRTLAAPCSAIHRDLVVVPATRSQVKGAGDLRTSPVHRSDTKGRGRAGLCQGERAAGPRRARPRRGAAPSSRIGALRSDPGAPHAPRRHRRCGRVPAPRSPAAGCPGWPYGVRTSFPAALRRWAARGEEQRKRARRGPGQCTPRVSWREQ